MTDHTNPARTSLPGPARPGPSRRALLGWTGGAAVALALAGPAGPAGAAASPEGYSPEGTDRWPATLPLPTDFHPEGIAIGSAPYAYFGSLVDGSIYRVDLRTGRGRHISPGSAGAVSVGLKLDERHARLFVAGGDTGRARVISTRTGETLATYQLSGTGPHFINDVILAPGGAWFTDSFDGALYLLPLDREGRLPAPDRVVRVPLGGDWQQVPQQPGGVLNANGISLTPDGNALLVVQTQHGGQIHRVDPRTGRTSVVPLPGAPATGLANGDGLVTCGRELYVVENSVEGAVDAFRLSGDGRSGRQFARVHDERFDTPSTGAVFNGRLYIVNGRFDQTAPSGITYTAVAIPLPRP